jgi:hypothetical protein
MGRAQPLGKAGRAPAHLSGAEQFPFVFADDLDTPRLAFSATGMISRRYSVVIAGVDPVGVECVA